MIAVTPWRTMILDGQQCCEAGEVEIRDLARGLAGALFVSLPLLFTMEMWQIARRIPDTVLLAFLAIAFLVVRLFINFSGYRRKAWQRSKTWDALVAMGLGVVASVITLFVAGIISLELDYYISAKIIALEAVPTAIGAAVAMNQLGGGDSAKDDGFSPDVTMVLASFLGGVLFAFNVAPTIEPKVIVLKLGWWQIGATFLLSLGISYMMVAIANFETRDLSTRKIIDSEWLEAAIAYIIAFLVSMLLLWVFGYATITDPLEVWLPQTILLAYATTLGGAAGRLVL
ncbi:DUF2391 family protein [Sphingomicrobium astaxanthinifaciens]|uniref:DUF2391 family protein n=1 Tax=Sphingomicrobium astaxanthinifaciens TaxID=1227949 RepID=UPI001FCCBA49|nr:DUF2391 family protein [Sphingomicrobium astaxanthinifaciens]MCJ7420489.1 TIGR02587 family membrane protein [Sphingomicrobium astaxanthinifaciens]